ncbi:MAG: hypothetical protein WCC57_12600 [Paracoccaceae bacterium]
MSQRWFVARTASEILAKKPTDSVWCRSVMSVTTICFRGLRHLTIARAIYWFDVNEAELRVRILAIFFGGQDHVRLMLTRLLSPSSARSLCTASLGQVAFFLEYHQGSQGQCGPLNSHLCGTLQCF